MAEAMYNRSMEIKSLCQVEQYDLYFSGKVGIGKSTLICMLLGLINNDNLTADWCTASKNRFWKNCSLWNASGFACI